MKTTNKHGLPTVFLELNEKFSYSKGKSNYSVSSIETPPRILHLTSRHYDELQTDISENIWSLFGSMVHEILSKSNYDVVKQRIANLSFETNEMSNYVNSAEADATALVGKVKNELDNIHQLFESREKRLYMNFGGIIISGQYDMWNEEIQSIDDYKVTKVYKVREGNYDDYIARMNIYRLLFLANGMNPKRLRIIAILKDWTKTELERDTTDTYPKLPVHVIEIPVWDRFLVLQYVLDKLALLEKSKNTPDEQLPFCSMEDKWQRPSRFGVKKLGNKRNTKVFDDEKDAKEFLATKGDQYVSNKMPSKAIRCEDYCLVKNFCNQYKQEHEELQDKVIPVDKELDGKELESLGKEIVNVKVPNVVAVPKDVIMNADPPEVFEQPKAEEKKPEELSLEDLIGGLNG